MKMDWNRFAAIFSVLISLFMVNPMLEAKEKRYNFGFTVGACWWPSDVFKYTRIYPGPSFLKSYSGLSILEQRIKLRTLYRLNFQYNFSSHFGLEGEVGHQRASYKVFFYLIPKYLEFRGNYKKHRLSWSVSSIILNAVFQARKSEEKVVPYGFLGLGICSVKGEKEEGEKYEIELHSSLDLAMKVGGGITYYLAKLFPLGLNLRAFILVLGTRMSGFYWPYGGSDITSGTDIVLEGYQIIWGIELGLRYRF